VRRHSGRFTIDAWVSHKTSGRMELAYEVEALATGWRLGLHTSDWRNLVALAHRYGWKPTAGLDRYLHERKQVVPAYDARALAEALKRAWETFRRNAEKTSGHRQYPVASLPRRCASDRIRTPRTTSLGSAAGSSRKSSGCAGRVRWSSDRCERPSLTGFGPGLCSKLRRIQLLKLFDKSGWSPVRGPVSE
jgi:hypothetical protein